MDIFKVVPRFSAKTGKQTGTQKEWAETRCDATGEVVRSVADENCECYGMLGLDYGDSDSCFGSSGDEFELGEAGVDMHEFLGGRPYVFASESGQYTDKVMTALLRALEANSCLDGALRALRTATAHRLLKEGVIKAEQLSED